MTPKPRPVNLRLIKRYLNLFPNEVARILEEGSSAEVVSIVEPMDATRQALILDRMMDGPAARVLEAMSETSAKSAMSVLDPARTSALLMRLNESQSDRLLNLMDDPRAKEIRALMRFPRDSAGRLMDPNVTVFRSGTTAARALSRLRSARRRILDVCVVDDENHLIGLVPVRELALALPRESLQRLIKGPLSSVHAMASRETVVEILTSNRATSLPVVDLDGRLMGIIRYDALVAAAEAEASVDIQTMVGASKEERALSSPWFAIRKRLPWLQINLATAFLAASVVGLFEDTIARFTALAVLLPVVAGQSGNTGAQALAVTMRGLALREIRLRHALRVSSKETLVGLVNGVAVAIVTSLGVFVWSRSMGLCLVIGSAMVISMVIAGLSGSIIPMALSALGQDPAQSSSIILTTVTDVVGFFSFLGLATLFSSLL